VTGDKDHISEVSRKRDMDARVARMLAAGRYIGAPLREEMTSGHRCLDDETGLPQ
jgi:hypothetical protein